jgi:hypothetical protein
MSRRNMTAIVRALGETSTGDTKHYHAAPLGHGYVCHDPGCASPNTHIDIA